MKTLRKDVVRHIMGFNFHLPAGYPAPEREELTAAWNTANNAHISNFRDRDLARRYRGTELQMEYDWKSKIWRVKEIFFHHCKTIAE